MCLFNEKGKMINNKGFYRLKIRNTGALIHLSAESNHFSKFFSHFSEEKNNDSKSWIPSFLGRSVGQAFNAKNCENCSQSKCQWLNHYQIIFQIFHFFFSLHHDFCWNEVRMRVWELSWKMRSLTAQLNFSGTEFIFAKFWKALKKSSGR